MIHHKDLTSVQ